VPVLSRVYIVWWLQWIALEERYMADGFTRGPND
jgi:hypothetical protein